MSPKLKAPKTGAPLVDNSTDDEIVEALKVSTEALADLERTRAIHSAARRAAVQVLRSRDWSLQRIADEIGISKNAVVQITNSKT